VTTMTTRQLIEHIQRLDPAGTMKVYRENTHLSEYDANAVIDVEVELICIVPSDDEDTETEHDEMVILIT
jgi:hypothetical protein